MSMSAVFVASVLATVAIMLAVARGWLDRADRRVLEAVRIREPLRADGKPKRPVTAARDLMAIGGDTVRLLFLAGCVAGLLAGERRPAAELLVILFVSARGALYGIKAVVRRERPDIGEHGVVTYTSSFPSGHTFMTVVLFLSAALLLPGGTPAAVTDTAVAFSLVTSLAVGGTRVAFGVHWPTDILAGWIAGIAWTTGCLCLAGALVAAG